MQNQDNKKPKLKRFKRYDVTTHIIKRIVYDLLKRKIKPKLIAEKLNIRKKIIYNIQSNELETFKMLFDLVYKGTDLEKGYIEHVHIPEQDLKSLETLIRTLEGMLFLYKESGADLNRIKFKLEYCIQAINKNYYITEYDPPIFDD